MSTSPSRGKYITENKPGRSVQPPGKGETVTEAEFTKNCNLRGFKYLIIKDFWEYRGKMLSLLIITRGKLQIRLTVYKEDVENHPSQVFKKAWDVVLRKANENDNEIVVRGTKGSNTLWEQTLKHLNAKEGRNERGNAGRARI